jgi:hypothetical protein
MFDILEIYLQLFTLFATYFQVFGKGLTDIMRFVEKVKAHSCNCNCLDRRRTK